MGRLKVRRYIDEALRETAARRAINQQLMNQWVERAWIYLEHRRDEDCGDIDLANAQHYMEARRWVGWGGDIMYAAVKTWVYGYAGVKFAAFWFGQEDLLRMGSCPPSPPSTEQIYWGLKGVEDGWFDHTGGISVAFM